MTDGVVFIYIYNDLVYDDDVIDIDRYMDEADRITNRLRMRLLISN